MKLTVIYNDLTAVQYGGPIQKRQVTIELTPAQAEKLRPRAVYRIGDVKHCEQIGPIILTLEDDDE